MQGLDRTKKAYDVFLAHHSADKVLVQALANKLQEAGISIFLDSDSLVPGEAWASALEAVISTSRCFLLCIGSSGLGPWTEEEVNVALARKIKEPSFAFVPVLLPGASREQLTELSLFVQQYQAVDLRRGFEDVQRFEQLITTLQAVATGSFHTHRKEGLLPSQIEAELGRLQGRFSDSLRHHLAGNQLIRRKETQELLTQLDDVATRVIVVHGVAGAGKSGVLFELATELAERGMSFLPLRLDRYKLQRDPRNFGINALGLPASPAKCLAALSTRDDGFLLLDQLDALRWTSAHSSEAWDVCREMIAEALVAGLKVVVCCRTFDLDHDPQLRGWEQETKYLRRIEVQQLTMEEVTAAIQRVAEEHGGSIPDLRPKEQDLLRRILHLQMWLAIYMKAKTVPAFDTAWTLIGKFWSSRLDDLAEDGVNQARAEELERRLVAAVQAGAVLSAPVRVLGMTERELKLYQDHHLIQVDEHQAFTFCHQGYQDYLVAKHLLGELDQTKPEQGGNKVVEWLGSRENQSLFRREQLRLVLVALRAEGHEAYWPALQELLSQTASDQPSSIRFHLRLLTLQFLSQVNDPRPEEIQLVLALLDQPFWRGHVLAEVMRGQVPWFEILDDQGRLESWLAGEDPQAALDMLLYVVEKCGDRVARLLTPYLEKDETWTRRIIWVLRFDPSQDSDALFDLRLKLAKDGSYTADHVDWDKLVKSHPIRFILLVSYILMAFAVSVSQGESRRRPGRRTEIDWYGFEEINSSEIPREYWAFAWEMLFRSMGLVAQVRAYPEESQHILESYVVQFQTLTPVLRLLKDLGRALFAENWLELITLGEELSEKSRRSEVLFLDSLVEGPAITEFADWALGWLMADPWRVQLRLRRSLESSALAGQLVERFTPVCSPETYCRLEQFLLTYREPDMLENYKRRHEWISRGGDLKERNSFGRTSHALLPRLPAERRSAAVNSRLKELSRKFPIQSSSGDEEDEAVKVGWVGSPLSDEARTKMGDEHWIAIATNHKLPVHWGKARFERDGRVKEASVETFAREFQTMTQRQPERFAMLALRLPPTANPAFLDAILSGLAWPGDREPKSEDWTPPSHEILEGVLALPTVQALSQAEDLGAARDVCHILERYSEYAWSASVIELLIWIAQNHSDPKGDFYPIGSSSEDSEHFDRLENNALNVTRGVAGFAIRNLLFKQPMLFESLRPALESLVRDEHPAVRVAAIAACLPVINTDRNLAVEWFLEACEGPDAILATREAMDFLRYTYRTHLDRLRPLIERMVASPVPRVATAGAFQVAACFLVAGQLGDEFEHCLNGSPPQRKGVAEVAASLLGEGEYADNAKVILLRLANDEDEKVAQIVARSFEHLDLRHITSDRDAWNTFARSKAFQADPSPLLHALERQTGKLLPFADCLLAVGTTFAEELAEASQNMATGIAADVRLLLPLLLRLYEEAEDRDKVLHIRCLDLWDYLLERRIGAAMGLTKELDRV